MTQPRIAFATPVVVTADVRCPKCGSVDLRREVLRGASMNPPIATAAEWRHAMALTECGECYWMWNLLGPSDRGMYSTSPERRTRHHDPGDEDRSRR